MRRIFTSYLLLLALLTAGVGGVWGHEHAVDQNSVASCSVDHEATHSCDPCADAHLDAAAHPHEHRCDICHYGRDRAPGVASTTSPHAAAPQSSLTRNEDAAAVEGRAFRQAARGPPEHFDS